MKRRALASSIAGAVLLGLSQLSVVPTSPAAAAPAGTEHRPDLQTLVPTDSFSVVSTPTGKEFRYTHLVYNDGPGPLEVQPSYDQASGGYRGMQQLYTHDAAGAWSMTRQVRVPDTFVYHAEHGHFHFPLAAFGLYRVAAGGGVVPRAPTSSKMLRDFAMRASGFGRDVGAARQGGKRDYFRPRTFSASARTTPCSVRTSTSVSAARRSRFSRFATMLGRFASG